MQLNEALSSIFEGISKYLSQERFLAVYPEGADKSELPVTQQGDKSVIAFTGEKGNVKLVFEDKKLSLLTTDVVEEVEDDDFKTSSVSLLDLENANEADINYIIDEFNETLAGIYSEKALAKKGNSKLPTPISKSAAKSGVASYDPNTLANRLFSLYPEKKDALKENIDTYGEFLPEKFFEDNIVDSVMATIRANDKQKMKKLFNILNEIYEDGTNETQSLIVVTVLGNLSDPVMLENACNYMDDTLKDPVVAVNKFFATSAGKKARQKLQNPPPYKPKKKKDKPKSMFAQMLGI